MAALPNVGSDLDIWGTELNNFLGVALNPDGTLQQITDNEVSDAANIDPTKLALPLDNTVVMLGDGTFGPPPGRPVTNVTTVTGSYTFVLSDGNGVVCVNTSVDTTVTVPPNVTVGFSLGVSIEVINIGTGQVTFAPAGGVAIAALNGHLAISGRYGRAGLRQIAINSWVVAGDLTAGGVVVPPPTTPNPDQLPMMFGQWS